MAIQFGRFQLLKKLASGGMGQVFLARTGQEGFWYMGGSLAECRNYSRYVAVQIKAAIEGLVPSRTAPDPFANNAKGASNG